ncbi:putative E3 ubiquitin-protein ligase HERC1 [Phytophthora ramorum]|uniref:putative E3 ubiquitin-protein ligase HERC1 n=1 Tax=Phytophthora ramorum TaxID=164328 RepID=UPI003096926A|nr:putative E3 ubiquitin-protein ligase HERC1 [Phytophthora ramorum]
MEAEELDLLRANAAVASSSVDTSDQGPGEDVVASANDAVPQTEAPRAEAEAWGTGDDEDGWMPKPARLHSGRTRSCAVCFASLQYTVATSWDEYLQSEEYLQQLQANVLQDAFVSALICGENTAGDLPTEHRMHKNRKLKCRQSVVDYRNMTSAGVVDKSGMEKGSIRTLEEMLIEALPTPVFTHVLERRLAVISHSSKIACELMSHDGVKKIPRPVETAPANEELHHLAIHTLSALLGAFDYKNPQALRPFEELSQLLTCFPVLSLYSFWSPTKKAPDKALVLSKKAVEASSVTSSSDSHGAHCAVDGVDNTFWQSQPRPGIVNFILRSTELEKVTSITIDWHMKYVPQGVGVQYREKGSEKFVQLVEDRAVSPSGPTLIEISFPPSCQEARIVMSGTPSSNRNGTYAIEHLRLKMPAPGSLFTDPKSTLSAVASWLLGALETADEVMAAEAISALRAWALSTASLSVTMQFVNMLLSFKGQVEDLSRDRIAALALEQGRQLYNGINAYHREKSQRLAYEGDKIGFGDVRRVAALFESSVCSTGVIVEDGGLVVRTRETSYQYAAVNCGISSGKASWKFRLDTDTQDDEMTCFGAAILPVTVNGYDSSPSLWMLRGYNGNLYARGHKLSRTIGKVHPGDIIQVDVDMSEGSLSYKINGTDYGVVFTDLAGHEVHPAVSFYGSGKVITLLGVTNANLESIGSHNIKDPAAELGVLPELIADLRGELEAMAHICDENDTPKMKLAEDIEKAAAETIVVGISVLYPSPIEKLELLLQLLRSYIDRPFNATSASYFVMTSVMELLAAPGSNGILTFMPFMATEAAEFGGSGSHQTEDVVWNSAVTDTVGLLMEGKLYRLTTQEFANGGDPWYKKENLPDEEYDESFIKILRDCYASGSVGFPGSQNMMGAAYGVPTFMVQDETPLASLPRFVPPHGCLSLRFNSKKKLNSLFFTECTRLITRSNVRVLEAMYLGTYPLELTGANQ